MGEYATRKRDGVEVKIGTCESMYYLRADQRALVRALPGNVNVQSDDVFSIRFRFPWPDEDNVLPGEFEPYERAIWAPNLVAPAAIEHGNVQFVAHVGYLTSLPCPEDPTAPATPFPVHRNGFAGAVQLVQQKLLRDGRLVPVCHCGGCGTAWRLEDPSEIEALAVAFRTEADSRAFQGRVNGTSAADRRFHDQIADRILAGARL